MSLLFKSSKQTTRHQAKIAVVLAVVLVLALNIFSTQFFARFDLTDNKDYSLSPATRAILSKIKGTVVIKAYFSANLPGYLAASNQAVRDLLSEYEKAGKGKIILTYLDPSKDQKIAQEAAQAGIPPLQFNVVQKDKYEVTNGYLGLAIAAGQKKQSIPLVENTASLEYDLSAAINKVTREKTPTVGIVSDESAVGGENGFNALVEFLRRQYFVREFSLSELDTVPSDVDVLLLVGLSEPLSPKQKYGLDQFLMSGRSLAIFASGAKVDLSTLTAAPVDNGLNKLLAAWGVRQNGDLVMDVSNEMQSFRNNVMQFFIPYPPLVKVVKSGFNRESGIVNKLEGAVFPFVSSLEILNDKISDKTKSVWLAKSTERAWTQSENFILNPQGIPAPAAGAQKQFTLAAMLSGRFVSAFTADSIPPAAREKKATAEEKKNFKQSTSDGRLIVVGDSDFASDQGLARWQGNAVLAGNMVDALSGEQSLADIRSKSATDRPLRQISDSARSGIKWANILVMTALFVWYGLIRFARRRKTLAYD